MKDKIKLEQLEAIQNSLEITVGKVLTVEDVLKSKKLIKLTVDFGNEQKVVLTNIKPEIGDFNTCQEYFTGQSFLFITNLEPVNMMGIESHAMILPGTINPLEKNICASINAQAGTKIF